MERRKYLFKGRVQGVGFRFRCFSIANELKLTGFVKNEYDGSVSMEVQGKCINNLLLKLNKFIIIC